MMIVLCELLSQPGAVPNHRDAIVVGPRRVTWGGLRELASSMTATYQRYAGRRVALRFAPAVESYALLFALEALHADLVLLDSNRPFAECEAQSMDLRQAALFDPHPESGAVTVREFDDAAEGSGTATVTILTSGTTGKPKAVQHTWATLSRPLRPSDSPSPRWLQPYRPNLYAGLQVLLQCLGNWGTLYVPAQGWEVDEIAAFIAANQIEFISATPSWWRRLLLLSDPATLTNFCLRQITLGGEVVDQALLNALKDRFPGARIVHIYATTELGRCFSVTDSQEGFPKRYLDKVSPDGVELRIEAGELLVRPASEMAGCGKHRPPENPQSGWFATGDLVAINGDRVLFAGRKTDTINVGGNKVHPLEIERILRSVPGVRDLRVFPRKSSITGEVVACEVVSDRSCSDEGLQFTIAQACQEKLASWQRPRFIKIVERIELSSAQKVVRSDNR